ncbi:efflux RND transporter periplasmic adaptor subunit [Olivibacter sp. SDN3]|uniref:efflux RND transporter periplasmic adaptor subunit n=1 Tax=Olivibacter sp. SDN3 TaxID=2764720 RepID=UPI001650E2BF|nr:efflux RND transporter periplasmic adaptor subunit [Olivibacter sp. SDN3]QNL49318.1 efflux RND transporter periplasmic adaptor subunit [Olivibacter sp. SDN3]
MKRNYINKILALVLLLFIQACSSTKEEHATSHEAHGYETVDTTILQLTGATNRQIVSNTPTISVEKGSKVLPINISGRIIYDNRNATSISSRISGRIERLYVKYNYQPVKKGQLLLEIYSPELVTAQRELLMLHQQQDEKLLQAAVQKLQYLGFSAEQIQQLLQSKNVLYRVPIYSPASGYILEKPVTPPSSTVNTMASVGDAPEGEMDGMNNSSSNQQDISNSSASAPAPVILRTGQYLSTGQTIFNIYTNTDLIAEFAIPPSIATQIQKGKKVLFNKLSDTDESYLGEIRLIQPTFNAGENFSLARVYLKKNAFTVGELLNGTVAITTHEGYWLPKQAVIRLGKKSVVFRKEGRIFRPISVNTGISTANMIQVLNPIEHWLIAENASYLVDSEDFIISDDE